jgi:hypothetical protein
LVLCAGHEIGSIVILYGADGKPTSAGVYSILERAERHRSMPYGAQMSFMLRLTPDEIAIHASTVRAAAVRTGAAWRPRRHPQLMVTDSPFKAAVLNRKAQAGYDQAFDCPNLKLLEEQSSPQVCLRVTARRDNHSKQLPMCDAMTSI